MTAEEIQRHILDVATGRVRLGLSPAATDEYLQEQYRKLRAICGGE